MLTTIEHLKTIIEQNYIRLQLIPESFWSDRREPSKWSKKEILGHLVDSAHNNLRRLIVTQYHQGEKIVYDQDRWVASQGYHHMPSNDLIELWKLMNHQLIRTSQLIPSDRYHFTTDIGQKELENTSIEQLIEMYIDHLQHHLHQIFGE
ncbi:MAG: DinB family protein [Saprospiraceae bacterium]|nr:DinB family protein [Saprospiraceae bacterium]